MERMIEVCAGSYQDCIAAHQGSAKRVELNSALSVGGLTPSVASLIRVKKETDLTVICMVRVRAAGFCYEKKEFLDIFTIGIPASITNLMSSIGVALTNRYLVVFGNENVAAMGIALKVNMILLLIMVGFAFGAQPLLGFNYGAKNTERLRAFIKFDIFIEVTFALITAVILSIFAPYIIQSFMNDAHIIQTGSLMLRLLVLSSPCVGIILVFTTLFQSEGKALPALILSISRQGVIYAICIVILSKLFTFHGILISQATADVVTAIIAILIYSKQKTVTR